MEGLLPIGTVVLLKNSEKRLMIAGVCQKEVGEKETIWDYAGCLYPEGYLGADKVYLFNNEQIERIYALGYQDEEQFAFKQKIDQIRESIRSQGNEQNKNSVVINNAFCFLFEWLQWKFGTEYFVFSRNG